VETWIFACSPHYCAMSTAKLS